MSSSVGAVSSQEKSTDPSAQFLEFIRAQAAALRVGDKPPATLTEWNQQRQALRTNLLQAWGGFPTEACPLETKKLGEFQRDGYRVEKIIFQTRPGVWMTANAYVPDRVGKLPAVLAVHGHWPGAKQDPVVQSRCIGLAKLGFFVLVVDAFGAGERGVGKALGEYHGDMTAATLLPLGLTLCGLQVYENMRAVDYLLSRPEVDGTRVGITGASGGGNQTMNAGGWDERFAAVVPVCSVGNYQAYLGEACCMCEVVPGALRFTEEWAVLGLSAPRPLLIINATKDHIQFSVRESNKSVALAQSVFDCFGQPERIEHAIFESPHAYSRPMRETMYGWMTQYLKAEGDGSLILEPELKMEDPEFLRCYPGNSRPENFTTIPRFASAEAAKLLDRIAPIPAGIPEWRAQREAMRNRLGVCLGNPGDRPAPAAHLLGSSTAAAVRTITFEPEPNLTLTAREEPAVGKPRRLAVLLDLEQGSNAVASPVAAALRAAGWSVVTLDLRATGRLAPEGDGYGRAPDHNSSEWALWIGRPLLGQWLVDVRGLLDVLEKADGAPPSKIALVGIGPAGVVATFAAALDDRVTDVVAMNSLASYVSDVPYEKQRLGIIVPGLLRDVGDIQHVAALIAPRTLVFAGGVNGAGVPIVGSALEKNFAFTRRAYALHRADTSLHVLPDTDVAAVVQMLK